MIRRNFIRSITIGGSISLSGCTAARYELTGETPEELEAARDILQKNEVKLNSHIEFIEEHQTDVESFDPNPYVRRANEAKEEIRALGGEQIGSSNVELAEALLLVADQHISAARFSHHYMEMFVAIDGAIDHLREEKFQRALSRLGGAKLQNGHADNYAKETIDIIDELESDYQDYIEWKEMGENRRDFVTARDQLEAMTYVIDGRDAEFEGFSRLDEGHEEYGAENYSRAEFKYSAAREYFSTAYKEIDTAIDHGGLSTLTGPPAEYYQLQCELENLEEASHHYEVGAQEARQNNWVQAKNSERQAEARLEEADQCRTP